MKNLILGMLAAVTLMGSAAYAGTGSLRFENNSGLVVHLIARSPQGVEDTRPDSTVVGQRLQYFQNDGWGFVTIWPRFGFFVDAYNKTDFKIPDEGTKVVKIYGGGGAAWYEVSME